MSGHSKWHSIKHKKGAIDAKRGKIFTRHAKLIAIAARSGADVSMNPGLRAAIDNAKYDNVPNANIEKAIKKGAGLDKDAVIYEEIYYEGFGPCNVAMYVHVLTDNKNRAVSDVKAIMSKKGGVMGGAGTVAWMFERKGIINASLKDPSKADDMQLAAIDAGADDVNIGGDVLEIYTDPSALMKVRDNLKNAGFEINSAEITFVPKQTVKLNTEEEARKVLDFIDLLEENEDVSDVYCNFDIDEEILKKMA